VSFSNDTRAKEQKKNARPCIDRQKELSLTPRREAQPDFSVFSVIFRLYFGDYCFMTF
jgi:hypothetical protein